MSFEHHREAMEVWGRLSSLSDGQAKAKALDNESETNEVWATAAVSSMVLRSLGMAIVGEDGQGEDAVLWTKLYGRPLAKVHHHYREQKKRKPEERVGALTKFAKAVPCCQEAIDDLAPNVRESLRRGVA